MRWLHKVTGEWPFHNQCSGSDIWALILSYLSDRPKAYLLSLRPKQFIIHFQLALKEGNFDSSLISWSFGNLSTGMYLLREILKIKIF